MGYIDSGPGAFAPQGFLNFIHLAGGKAPLAGAIYAINLHALAFLGRNIPALPTTTIFLRVENTRIHSVRIIYHGW